jgi:hypothetical protein
MDENDDRVLQEFAELQEKAFLQADMFNRVGDQV